MNHFLVIDEGSVWKLSFWQFAEYLRHRRAGYLVNLGHYGTLIDAKVVDLTDAKDGLIAELCREYRDLTAAEESPNA
jgi:hypothetical protein